MKNNHKKAVAVLCGTMMAASLSLTACGGASTAESVDLREVPLDTILEKAKEEGQINSVGMPDDWANWRGSWAAVSEKYGLTHEDTDMSSAEELSTFETEKDAATKDIGDVGQAFGPTAVEMDVVQPYKASTWDSIPDWAKDPDGKWCISYVGTMSAMVNADRVSTTIDSWQALKDSAPPSPLATWCAVRPPRWRCCPAPMRWAAAWTTWIQLSTSLKKWPRRAAWMPAPTVRSAWTAPRSMCC